MSDEGKASPIVAMHDPEKDSDQAFGTARLSLSSGDNNTKHAKHDVDIIGERVRHSIGSTDRDVQEGQIFSMLDVDPALDAKMRLVNQVRR